ncbi:hypothetical protein GGQ64_000918 [Rhizobium azooxidifex]|uniref:Uncharacterized protein n=1 Tax=Mycoplana azooxidifex TaxID=1636188 RepID=A0A7W6D6X2_9HYPH|nr:hypothetical protein [Mycoplana azooxidifex]MBB3975731.1 hypothetical protein [Mycoplana azooxidifex]
MIENNRIEVLALRQIGWDHWDPIGIRQFGDLAWQNEAADEYDHYLLHAARMIQAGSTLEAATEYLERIITEHMGLGAHRNASLQTIDAIAAYLRS